MLKVEMSPFSRNSPFFNVLCFHVQSLSQYPNL
jgi:hypothetical protein